MTTPIDSIPHSIPEGYNLLPDDQIITEQDFWQGFSGKVYGAYPQKIGKTPL